MPRSPPPSRSKSYSHSRSRSPVKRRRSATPDQEELSPFLIRIYVTKGKHVPLVEFDEGNIPLRDEFQVYGWKSSTPTSLIRSLLPSFPAPYRSPLARYSFRHIYVDASSRGLYRSKDLVSFTGRDLFSQSSTSSSAASTSKTKVAEGQNKMGMAMDLDEFDNNNNNNNDERGNGKKVEEKSLDEYGFVTGDLLSVSLYVPEPKIPAGGRRELSGPGSGPGASLGGNGIGTASGNGNGNGIQIRSFGWGDKDKSSRNNPREEGSGPTARDGPGSGSGSGRGGHWGRGGPLPPQEFRGSSRGGFGAGEPANGGSWRGGAGGAAGPGAGLGIRGQGRSGRRSPDVTRDRDDDRGNGRRSRSPESRERRESWSRRR
ncbi:uncharacterized protein IL334_001670 [Kwoniella shivajii]|uniref:Histone deacetylase complex subunit n=1 Tax=Kwoniella shivajii TaxID=564305 RepID=A0ABZ1CSL4_9TREE|nr:hypothetical protein IL334_001670 [Kwoniella shivajii]